MLINFLRFWIDAQLAIQIFSVAGAYPIHGVARLHGRDLFFDCRPRIHHCDRVLASIHAAVRAASCVIVSWGCDLGPLCKRTSIPRAQPVYGLSASSSASRNDSCLCFFGVSLDRDRAPFIPQGWLIQLNPPGRLRKAGKGAIGQRPPSDVSGVRSRWIRIHATSEGCMQNTSGLFWPVGLAYSDF